MTTRPSTLRRILPLITMLTVLPVSACAGEPAGQVDVGRAIYQERCASCHGAQQQGTDTGPPLTDVTPADIRRAVTEGMDEDPAYPEMAPLPLTEGQVDAVAAFLTQSPESG